MAFRWIIKRYGDDPIKVSENVGRQALAAWEAGAVVIKLPNNMSVSGASISAIEPTHESQEEDTIGLIGSGDMKKEAILDLEGNVLTNWYKKNVGATMYEKHYAALPFYHRLVDDDKNVWVAMRLPAYKNDLNSNPDLIACDEYEAKMLDKIGTQ